MGNSGGKNRVRTHPSEEGPSPGLMDPQYGDIYDKDQHRDYDSGVRLTKVCSGEKIILFQIISVAQ